MLDQTKHSRELCKSGIAIFEITLTVPLSFYYCTCPIAVKNCSVEKVVKSVEKMERIPPREHCRIHNINTFFLNIGIIYRS